MAEGEDPALISSSIRRILGRKAEVFVPASVTKVGEDRVVTYLVDGYAFVKHTLTDYHYFKLEDTRYVQSVVRDIRSRQIAATIPDSDIERFRRQVRAQSDQGIDVGDTVTVTSGPYRNLQAVVIEDIPECDSVQVRIELRSKDSLVTLPRSFLRLVSKASLPAYVRKTREHRSWFDLAVPALRWDPVGYEAIRNAYAEHQRLTGWIRAGREVQAEIRLEDSDARLGGMRELLRQVQGLTRWEKTVDGLRSFLVSFSQELNLDAIRQVGERTLVLRNWTASFEGLSRHVAALATPLRWDSVKALEDTYTKLHSSWVRYLDIQRAVVSMERGLTETDMTDNVVIDGMNMVVRCAMAPGLNDLRDSTGRYTGSVVGFLNSLASLRKKYPGADLWVCWDNPSTRRKALYEGYKSNRNPLRNTYEVNLLKQILPRLGVWQASAEGEEADDVVASLVRGRLEGQRNVVVSNDRDFMQLVSPTNHVLVPSVGVGKERLCTPEVVEAEYGVPPERMLHLRALGGDSSDNLPGAPGCGNKTASKLVQLYGTVDGIFVSNLAGLSQSLRTKLREAEKQVRLNLTLMALVTGLELTIQTPEPDQAAVVGILGSIEMNPSRVVSAFFQVVGDPS